MTTITTVNIDLCIAKLDLAIERANNGTYAQVKTALLDMAKRGLEQQQSRIAELESARQPMDAAFIEAAMPPKIVEAILHIERVEMAE